MAQQNSVEPQVVQRSCNTEEGSQELDVIQKDRQGTILTSFAPFSPNVTQPSISAPFNPNITQQIQVELSESSLTFEDLWDLYGPSDNSADPWDYNET